MKKKTKRILAALTGLTLMTTSMMATSLDVSAINVSNKIVYGVSYCPGIDGDGTIIGNKLIDVDCSDDDLITELKDIKLKSGIGLYVYIANAVLKEEYNLSNLITVSMVEDYQIDEDTFKYISFTPLSESTKRLYDLLNSDELYADYVDELKISAVKEMVVNHYTDIMSSIDGIDSISLYDLFCNILVKDELTTDDAVSIRGHLEYLTPVIYENSKGHSSGYTEIFENDVYKYPTLLPEYGVRKKDETVFYSDFDLNFFAPLKCTTKDLYDKMNVTEKERRTSGIYSGVVGVTVSDSSHSIPLSGSFNVNSIHPVEFNNYNALIENYGDSFTGFKNLPVDKLIIMESKSVSDMKSILYASNYQYNGDKSPDYVHSRDNARELIVPVDISSLVSNSSGNDHKLYYLYNSSPDCELVTGCFTLDDSYDLPINIEYTLNSTMGVNVQGSLDAGLTIPSLTKEDLKLMLPSDLFNADYEDGEINYNSSYTGCLKLAECTIHEDGSFDIEENTVKINYLNDDGIIDSSRYSESNTLQMTVNGEVVSEVGEKEAIAYTDKYLESNNVTFNTSIEDSHFIKCGNYTVVTRDSDSFEFNSDSYNSLAESIKDTVLYNSELRLQGFLGNYYEGISTAITDDTTKITHQPYYTFDMYKADSSDKIIARDTTYTDLPVNYYGVLLEGTDKYGTYVDTDYEPVEEYEYSSIDLVKLKQYLLNNYAMPVNELPIYDLNGDDSITIIDVVVLKKKLLS